MQGVVRVLKPGQQANIWLELVMPEENGDVFQVRCADARSAQSCEGSWDWTAAHCRLPCIGRN